LEEACNCYYRCTDLVWPFDFRRRRPFIVALRLDGTVPAAISNSTRSVQARTVRLGKSKSFHAVSQEPQSAKGRTASGSWQLAVVEACQEQSQTQTQVAPTKGFSRQPSINYLVVPIGVRPSLPAFGQCISWASGSQFQWPFYHPSTCSLEAQLSPSEGENIRS